MIRDGVGSRVLDGDVCSRAPALAAASAAGLRTLPLVPGVELASGSSGSSLSLRSFVKSGTNHFYLISWVTIRTK